MKTFTFFLLLVLIATGAFAGMLYAHVAPVTDFASKVPGAGPVLSTLGIFPGAQPSGSELSPTDQVGQTAEVAPLQKMFHLPRHHAHVRPVGMAKYDNPSLNTANKPTITARLARIYDTMPASFVARIMTHQSDNEAARELSAMNEAKAGQVIASIQPMRAAKIAAVMAGQADSAGKVANAHRDQAGIAIE